MLLRHEIVRSKLILIRDWASCKMKTHVPERNVVFSDSVPLKKGVSVKVYYPCNGCEIQTMSLLLFLFVFFYLGKFKIYPKGTEPSRTGIGETMRSDQTKSYK